MKGKVSVVSLLSSQNSDDDYQQDKLDEQNNHVVEDVQELEWREENQLE